MKGGDHARFFIPPALGALSATVDRVDGDECANLEVVDVLTDGIHPSPELMAQNLREAGPSEWVWLGRNTHRT